MSATMHGPSVFARSDVPLHIGFYSPALPDSGVSNGIVTYTRIMRDALLSLGHSVVVVTTEHIQNSDGSIAELPKQNAVVRRFGLMRERMQREDGSDAWVRFHIVNAFRAACHAGVEVFEMEESFGWAGRIAGRGVPIVERLHGPHVFGREPVESKEQRELGDVREAAELESFARVQAITSPAAGLLRAITERYDLSLSIARAIPNPVPLVPSGDAWDIDCVDLEQILCVGRFDLRKGADVVVRAFAKALQRRPSMTLVMAGPDTGLAKQDSTRIHFKEFVQRELSPEQQARIRFMGELPPQRLAELRRKSALTIVGSRFENFPYSIAEAMAVGMPVLTSATFGGSEMVRDGIEGRVVPVGDTNAMSDAMLEMISNPERLLEMGQASFKRVATWLSPERVARETVDVYRQAAGAS